MPYVIEFNYSPREESFRLSLRCTDTNEGAWVDLTDDGVNRLVMMLMVTRRQARKVRQLLKENPLAMTIPEWQAPTGRDKADA